MKKTISVLSTAGVVTFTLFVFMALLISNDDINVIEPLSPITIDVVQVPELSKPNVIVRKLPQPPEPPPQMKVAKTVIEPTDTSVMLNYTPATVSLPNNHTKPMSFGGAPNQDARPIVRINPKYPIAAARDGIQGWVQLAFDISKVGEVINIRVIDSEPKRVFDKAARQALKKWKYRAKSVDGVPVQQHNFTVLLDFNMEQKI